MTADMKRYIITLAACIVAFSSCDLLNLSPASQLTGDQYFRTEEDLRLFTNSFYNSLLEKEVYKVESDVLISKDPSDLIRGGNSRVVPASGGGWGWGPLRKMNTLLGNADKCPDAAAVKEYTALARFWRAFFYFEKIKKFGDVPWVDHELSTSDPDLFRPRDSRETVMQHMIEDIDFAIENLSEGAAAPETAYRVNRYTAMFLKAQFCLFEGTFRKYHSEPAPFEHSYKDAEGNTHDADWYLDQAIAAAELMMASSPYKLHTTGHPKSDYKDLFCTLNAYTDETILAINFDEALQIKHDATFAINRASKNGYGMTKKLVDQYLMADGTRFTDKPLWRTMPFQEEVADRDPRLAQTIRTPGYKWDPSVSENGPEFAYCVTGYQPIKFVMPFETNSHLATNSCNDIPVYRYAELLLNFAEAKAERGTITQADLDKSVNLVRARVGMPGIVLSYANANPDPYLLDAKTGYPNVSGANQGIILEIRRERAVELFMEGFGRYFDLIRWKAGYALNQPKYGMYIPGPGNYEFGPESKYTFYIGTTTSKLEKYRIYSPGGEALNDMAYLADPATGEYAESGNWEVLHHIPMEFDESKHYFYPLPEKDLQLNPDNLKQNPNW